MKNFTLESLNYKQQELADGILAALWKSFPEAVLLSVETSPEDPAHIWLNIKAPDDEERELLLRSFGAELCTDILLDDGYRISLMPEKAAAALHER